MSPSADAPEFTPIRVKVKEAQMQRGLWRRLQHQYRGALRGQLPASESAERGWILAANTSIETRRQFAEISLAAPQTAKAYTDSVFQQRARAYQGGFAAEQAGVSRERDTGVIKTVQALSYEREWSQVGDTEGSSRKQALVASYGWTRRDLDHPVLPNSGNVIALRLAGAARNISSEHQLGSRGRPCRPVAAACRMTGATCCCGEAGQVSAERVAGVPSAWLFRVGGANRVRGGEYQSIGIEQNGAVTGGEVEATGVSLNTSTRLRQLALGCVRRCRRCGAQLVVDFSPKRGYGMGVLAQPGRLDCR